jgi:signal peptidase II
VDRLVRGYVIDFIDWHWRNQPGMHWPTFNVADAAICVGVGLLLLDSLRARRPESAPAPLAEGSHP